MSYIAYGFIEKDMYDAEECVVDVFEKCDDALNAMNNRVNREIGLFVRDFGYAPIVIENKELHQVTMINCGEDEYEYLLATDDEIPRTDYRVIEVAVHKS